MNNATGARLSGLYECWLAKQDVIVTRYRAGLLPTTDDLTIWLPGCNTVVDYGLITNSGIYVYKLPELLCRLWGASYGQCVDLQNSIIDWQIRKSKSGGVTDEEIKYTAAITNLVAWTLKHKFGLQQGHVRRVTSGDLKRQTHYTVGGQS